MTRDAGPPATGAAEVQVLVGFLDYLRAAVAAKAEGVPEPQVRSPGVASGTNLLGLVKHLTHVEAHWLLGLAVTDWPHDLPAEASTETAEEILAAYRATTARANAVIMRLGRPRCAGATPRVPALDVDPSGRRDRPPRRARRHPARARRRHDRPLSLVVRTTPPLRSETHRQLWRVPCGCSAQS